VNGTDLPRGDDCSFCALYRAGEHVARRPGVVAVRARAPQAPVHLVVIPERHVPTFREVGEFTAEEVQVMLGFIAEAAEAVGLADYKVIVDVGDPGGSATHMHWQILGGRSFEW
jgi:histidine triad (HIT) family protein